MACCHAKKKLDSASYKTAKLAYFYKIEPKKLLEDYDIDEIEYLWQAITVIEAQEMLKDLTVARSPNYKKNDFNKLHKDLSKKAYPDTFKSDRRVSTTDLAKALGKMNG